MEKYGKSYPEKNKTDFAKDVMVALFGGYAITFFGIVILAFMLLLFQFSENMLEMGILAIYFFACLTAGIIAGKRMESRKILWGMFMGSLYFIIIFSVSLLLNQSMERSGRDVVTMYLICVGSGILGGRLS